MLTHNVSPLTRYMLIHRSDQKFTFDGNFALWNNNILHLSLYSLNALNQNNGDRSLTNKFHLRVHHENNKIFSLGVENWDVLSSKTPDVLSTWGIYGLDVNGWRPFVGANVAYRLSSNKFVYHNYLFGLKQKSFSTYAKAEVKREEEKLDLSLTFDSKVNSDIKVSADLKYSKAKDKELKKDIYTTNVTLVGEYRLDNATFLKGKISTDNSLILSITRNFRQLLNFCFVTQVMIN